jgi:hypothetical protein
MDPIPYEVLEAMVQCFGRCFYYKDAMEAFLLGAGVQRNLVAEFKHEFKFSWARHVLSKLGETDEGKLTLRKVLTELVKLKRVPDDGVKDRESALNALRDLRETALKHQIIVKKAKDQGEQRARLDAQRGQIIKERADRLARTRDSFLACISAGDRQAAGYSLEGLLGELFNIFEIGYTSSYRTTTQQIDGHFRFDGFDYLVEAKWRKDQPTEQEIGGFQRKVNSKLESTRGLFVSVAGYRAEVIGVLSGSGANVILMDGEHLMHVLEGRYSLPDLLRLLIDAAAQRGQVHVRLG